jgi:dihydrofolate reductase
MKIIVAINKLGYIGKDGVLPWYSPDDLKHFKEKTKYSTCLISRKTYDSLPESMKSPNDTRTYLIVSRDPNRGISLEQALLCKPEWVLGGAEIYEQTLHLCNEIHISIINNETIGDVKFPHLYGVSGDRIYHGFGILGFKGKIIKYEFDEETMVG